MLFTRLVRTVSVSILVACAMGSCLKGSGSSEQGNDAVLSVQEVVSRSPSRRMVVVAGKYLPAGGYALLFDAKERFCKDGRWVYECILALEIPTRPFSAGEETFTFAGWPKDLKLSSQKSRQKALATAEPGRNLPDCMVVEGFYEKTGVPRPVIFRFYGLLAESFASEQEREESMKQERLRKGRITVKRVLSLGPCQ
jgi:hypothetical protein